VTGPVGEPPLDALPPDAPATVEDVRGNRRWTVVALVWAVAASAIAVIALVQANNNDNNSSNTTTTSTGQSVSPSDFQNFQKQVNDRLDAFSRRLNDTASSADVQKLDKQLTSLSNDVSTVKSDQSKQGDSITQMQSDIKDLQNRVNKLESQQQSGGGGSGGTTTTP
jgi:septal ring factor EnvC (AmiA/AmiB activator)